MDSHFSASREDLYHVQMDVKHVQAVQTDHGDRLLRLEKRQADDAALRSVWGTGSPFPGVLSGTPTQGPVPNSSADVFDDFADEQSQNLLGSLHLEADDEPVRRGASRANSVRFDVSALQGSNWASGSRNSGEFGPARPNSGFGSHPMTERSLSHKSDGRHSSTGHSIHSMHSVPSGRTSSLGLDTNFSIGGHGDESPLDNPDPPPGLFILGPVPSIIRCWLTTSFSHNSLLYAVVCTGSHRSTLEYSLAKELGVSEQIRKDPMGRNIIRLPVYLPEAVIAQPNSRSNSPAPQLPVLRVDFEVVGLPANRSKFDRKRGIQVFLGSDALRAHNADILFSQNLMTLYGDDRNKLTVPFVRPEDENLFKYLCTSNVPTEKNELKATAPSFTPTDTKARLEPTSEAITSALTNASEKIVRIKSADGSQLPTSMSESLSPFTTVSTSDLNTLKRESEVGSARAGVIDSVSDLEQQHQHEGPEPQDLTTSSDVLRHDASGSIWRSWRHGSLSLASDNNRENESTSGYQRATRGGRSMKILKPSKPISSGTSAPIRSTSAARTGAAYELGPSRSSGESRRKSHAGNEPSASTRWETKRVSSEEQKPPRPTATTSRSSNPIGGASAFAWMNPNKPKQPATTAE